MFDELQRLHEVKALFELLSHYAELARGTGRSGRTGASEAWAGANAREWFGCMASCSPMAGSSKTRGRPPSSARGGSCLLPDYLRRPEGPQAGPRRAAAAGLTGTPGRCRLPDCGRLVRRPMLSSPRCR